MDNRCLIIQSVLSIDCAAKHLQYFCICFLGNQSPTKTASSTQIPPSTSPSKTTTSPPSSTTGQVRHTTYKTTAPTVDPFIYKIAIAGVISLVILVVVITFGVIVGGKYLKTKSQSKANMTRTNGSAGKPLMKDNALSIAADSITG